MRELGKVFVVGVVAPIVLLMMLDAGAVIDQIFTTHQLPRPNEHLRELIGVSVMMYVTAVPVSVATAIVVGWPATLIARRLRIESLAAFVAGGAIAAMGVVGAVSYSDVVSLGFCSTLEKSASFAVPMALTGAVSGVFYWWIDRTIGSDPDRVNPRDR